MPLDNNLDRHLHQELVAQLLRDKTSIPDITTILQSQGVHTSSRSLQRVIRIWREDPAFPQGRGQDRTDDMANTIETVSSSGKLSDKEISCILESQGISCAPRTVERWRLKAGVRHRDRSVPDQHERWNQCLMAVWNSLTKTGLTRNYGHALMSSYLHTSLGIRARQVHVKKALRVVHQYLGTQRTFRNVKSRRPFTYFRGPNWLWSLDGHDKLSRFGIEIYGAIDAYSRHVIFLYVGISNRAQVAVQKMYLEGVKACGVCPAFIRSDRGSETPLLADAQLTLYRAHQQALGMPFEEAQQLPLGECYIFGTSTANIRIESFWSRLLSSQTRPWLRYFEWLEHELIYDTSSTAHRAVFLYVFLPLLRTEIDAFRKVHNHHHIRHQKSRSQVIHGRPEVLYDDSSTTVGERFGFRPSKDDIEELLDPLQAYDLDTYLSSATMNWLDSKLLEVGKTTQIAAIEFIPSSVQTPYAAPNWFRQLLNISVDYLARGGEIELASKPYGGYHWIDAQQTFAEVQFDSVSVLEDPTYSEQLLNDPDIVQSMEYQNGGEDSEEDGGEDEGFDFTVTD